MSDPTVAPTAPPATRHTAAADSWAGRPAGVPRSVPPPSVPLSFLAAAAVGLVACGVAWVWVRSVAVSRPNTAPVIAAVHLGVLAALTMGILGATHQFTPVITARPLRSIRLARATFATWLAASWALPLGIGFRSVAATAASGALALAGLVLLLWNLLPPLSVRGKGAPVSALRLALVGAAATTLLGATFVSDRQGNWFVLSAHVDLAMGVLGLFAWLGVTYIGVAQKLWPMFMLAHVSDRRHLGTVAVWATWLGAAILAGGLAHGVSVAGWAGAALLGLGLAAHLAALSTHLRRRRRPADLHLIFVVTAAAWLVVAAGLGLAGVLVLPGQYHLGVALIAAAMVAAGGWLLEALVGHAHKVVPFIVWSLLRSEGARRHPSGAPLLFADLYHHAWAGVSYGTVTAGLALLCAGLAGSWAPTVAAGGALLAATGVVTGVNLSWRPLRLRAALRREVASDAEPAASGGRPSGGGRST